MRKRLTTHRATAGGGNVIVDELRRPVVIPVRPSPIAQRKSEHLDIVLSGNAAARERTNGLESIHFEHCALPELRLDEIRLETPFLGRRVAAPFLISSMTGGPEAAERINAAIAEAAQATRVAFAVGSQRIALEGHGTYGFGPHLRRLAPDVPILANFGAVQLKQWDGHEMARRAVDMIEADALILHLNCLQEAVQSGGDRDWSNVLQRIESLASTVAVPIVVKEVGAGISGRVARQLWNAGVRIIDVAGAGGTSWAAVEAQRARGERLRRIGEAFRDWGVPTARAVRDVRALCPEATIIASGGIRDGVEAAKAIRLGADMVAQAAGVLSAALDGPAKLVEHIEIFAEQLRIACFCTGSADIAQLKNASLLD
jgi:isopentenyl-diphosphate Delta-isomerase